MQATELNFIIQAKENKQYRNVMKFPCGIRQHNYNNAYKQAQEYLKTLKEHGLNCRLITKYLKLYKPNTSVQLNLVGIKTT